MFKAYIDIVYSDERRNEMSKYKEKNCYITKSLVEESIKTRFKVNTLSSYMPRENDRVVDISFEMEVESENTLKKIEEMIRTKLGKSAKSVRAYIDDIPLVTSCSAV